MLGKQAVGEEDLYIDLDAIPSEDEEPAEGEVVEEARPAKLRATPHVRSMPP